MTDLENLEVTNVYGDIWRLQREGQGMFKLTQDEINHLCQVAAEDNNCS